LSYGAHFGLGLLRADIYGFTIRPTRPSQQLQEHFGRKAGLLEDMRQSGSFDGAMGWDNQLQYFIGKVFVKPNVAPFLTDCQQRSKREPFPAVGRSQWFSPPLREAVEKLYSRDSI